MIIRFLKKRDGTTCLHCVRTDGSATGQRHQGLHFVYHDLTHYAVETVLGLSHAFYGTLAAGWKVSDFGTPWPRGRMPGSSLPDLMLAEHLTGFLDRERNSGIEWEPDELNHWLGVGLEAAGVTARAISEDEIRHVRDTMRQLFARWETVPHGDSLVLEMAPETHGMART